LTDLGTAILDLLRPTERRGLEVTHAARRNSGFAVSRQFAGAGSYGRLRFRSIAGQKALRRREGRIARRDSP
jgi:hypothetical protein